MPWSNCMNVKQFRQVAIFSDHLFWRDRSMGNKQPRPINFPWCINGVKAVSYVGGTGFFRVRGHSFLYAGKSFCFHNWSPWLCASHFTYKMSKGERRNIEKWRSFLPLFHLPCPILTLPQSSPFQPCFSHWLFQWWWKVSSPPAHALSGHPLHWWPHWASLLLAFPHFHWQNMHSLGGTQG